MLRIRIFGILVRDIAQLGRAPALGAGCRRFKSYYPEIIYIINYPIAFINSK